MPVQDETFNGKMSPFGSKNATAEGKIVSKMGGRERPNCIVMQITPLGDKLRRFAPGVEMMVMMMMNCQAHRYVLHEYEKLFHFFSEVLYE